MLRLNVNLLNHHNYLCFYMNASHTNVTRKTIKKINCDWKSEVFKYSKNLQVGNNLSIKPCGSFSAKPWPSHRPKPGPYSTPAVKRNFLLLSCVIDYCLPLIQYTVEYNTTVSVLWKKKVRPTFQHQISHTSVITHTSYCHWVMPRILHIWPMHLLLFSVGLVSVLYTHHCHNYHMSSIYYTLRAGSFS